MANIRRDASREGWELFEQYAGMKVFYTFDGIRCIIGVIIYQIFYFFQGEPEKGKIDFIHTMDKPRLRNRLLKRSCCFDDTAPEAIKPFSSFEVKGKFENDGVVYLFEVCSNG